MATDRTAAAGARARNPRGSGGRLRDDIVAAATELLDESGAAGGVTLRAVARRVGITAPAIYPHFPDPQAILLAVVQDEFARLREQLRTAGERSQGDPVSRLLAVCTAYLDFARTSPQRYLLLFGGVWDAGPAIDEALVGRADVAALGQDVLEDLTALLQRCVDAARSDSTDVTTDAVALWVGLHGLAHQRIAAATFPWPPDLEHRLIAHLAGLAPGGDRT